jgi:hypothetical protein
MSMKHVFISESAQKKPRNNVTLLEFCVSGTFSISNSISKNSSKRCRREEDDGAWEIKKSNICNHFFCYELTTLRVSDK